MLLQFQCVAGDQLLGLIDISCRRAVQVVAVSTCRWRSTEHSVLSIVFLGFTHNDCWAELSCERVRERNDSRCEQFEISSVTIDQELRPVVYEQRQTDTFYIIL